MAIFAAFITKRLAVRIPYGLLLLFSDRIIVPVLFIIIRIIPEFRRKIVKNVINRLIRLLTESIFYPRSLSVNDTIIVFDRYKK